jgi:gluconokinase
MSGEPVRANYPRVLAYAANVVIILMGVTGSGKSTAGRALADELGWRFVDGDDHHAPAAIAQMRAGVPLTDREREPWLATLHAIVARALDRREPLIVACSALKAHYRDILRGDRRAVRFVHLDADAGTLAQRLSQRTGHFAGPALLASQFAELEPPADPRSIAIDATRPLPEIVAAIRREFGV